MRELTIRNRNIISGLIALVLVTSSVTLGVASSFGAFDANYEVKASFDAAGQGLQKGSDVKIRGVNIGKVSSVRLVAGRAQVSMDIASSQRIPTSAEAVVRPKTLFGEKFVDVVPCPKADDPSATATEAGTCTSEGSGPFYATDGSARIPDDRTLGGFELERVLANAFPLFKDINPAELGAVIGGFADAGKGLGPEINRTIVNGQKVADVFAAHDADQRQFLADLQKVAGELGNRSDDVAALAKSLTTALPTINSRGDQLNALLAQLGRLSSDAADLLEGNKAFVDASLGPGDKVIQMLYDHRGDVVPLVVGLRQYVELLAEVARIPVGNGTYMAAVKGLLAGQTCGFFTCGAVAAAPAAAATSPSPSSGAASSPDPIAPALPSLPPITGANVINDLFGLLQGHRS